MLRSSFIYQITVYHIITCLSRVTAHVNNCPHLFELRLVCDVTQEAGEKRNEARVDAQRGGLRKLLPVILREALLLEARCFIRLAPALELLRVPALIVGAARLVRAAPLLLLQLALLLAPLLLHLKYLLSPLLLHLRLLRAQLLLERHLLLALLLLELPLLLAALLLEQSLLLGHLRAHALLFGELLLQRLLLLGCGAARGLDLLLQAPLLLRRSLLILEHLGASRLVCTSKRTTHVKASQLINSSH